jgi:hypothetical protein
MTSTTTSTETRALSLLGQGIGPEMVASAVGVSVSRISQLLSDPEFSAQVAELRFKNLSKHNERDQRYDSLEDKLIDKMEDLLPFMMKPLEILRAITVINGAKRRGASAPDQITQQQTVVNLLMPTQITNLFSSKPSELTLNINNQVVQAGTQSLITVQSGQMDVLLSKSKGTQNVQIPSLPNSNTIVQDS